MKFKEDEILQELKEFIDKSYTKHYSSSSKSTQTIDLIMELDDGAGFLKGNLIKYASRFGKKKDNPRGDLLKLMHYAILLYYFSFLKDDEKNEVETSSLTEIPHDHHQCSNCGMSSNTVWINKFPTVWSRVAPDKSETSAGATSHGTIFKETYVDLPKINYSQQNIPTECGVPIRTQNMSPLTEVTNEAMPSLIEQIYNPKPFEPKNHSVSEWAYDGVINPLVELENNGLKDYKKSNNTIEEMYAYTKKNRKS